nr:50S ribosomal protein L6P [uncultured archaeon]
MRQKLQEEIEIPLGVSCETAGRFIKCTKEDITLMREIENSEIEAKVSDSKIVLTCSKGNRTHNMIMQSLVAHIKNLFIGLQEKFTYTLEACNVHFPMTLKVEGTQLSINNFLGEKIPRYAAIMPGSNVEIKGQKITVVSYDIALAGQTAANIEKATKVRNRDRRVFQDGIYIVTKPRRSS